MARTDGRIERGIQTRERILDAAIELIAEGGAAAATQRRVADRVGMSVASTTYHFASARELVVAAMRRASGLATARLAEMQEEIMAGRISLEDATLDYIEAHRSGSFAPGLAALELSMAAVRDPELRASDEDNMTALETLYRPLLNDARRERAAAQAFTGLLLIELGSTRTSHCDETREAVRGMIEVFDLERAVARARDHRTAESS